MIYFLKYIYHLIFNRNANVSFYSNVSLNTVLGEGVKILPNVKLSSCQIKNFTYIGQFSRFSNTNVGLYCSIGEEVLSGLASHPTHFASTYPGFYNKSASGAVFFGSSIDYLDNLSVCIGDDVWIGTRSIILGGINIGTGAVIAAGSVVTKDVPPYAIVAGIPARIIKYRFDDEMIKNLLASEWWKKDSLVIKKASKYINDPYLFIKIISNN